MDPNLQLMRLMLLCFNLPDEALDDTAAMCRTSSPYYLQHVQEAVCATLLLCRWPSCSWQPLLQENTCT